MIITLHHIADAIKKNFVMAKIPTVILEVDFAANHQNISVGRMVFLGAAITRGFSSDAICRYLDMSGKEFEGKLMRYKSMMLAAREKEKNLKKSGMHVNKIIEKDNNDKDLRLLWKARLVDNCLNLIALESVEVFSNDV